jgi:uncharacterized protein YndB with AHSA1/START domain
MEGIGVQSAFFTYTTLIGTTSAKLWQALTDPAFTRRYRRGLEFETDWKPGSTITFRNLALALVIADPEQVILESDPYRCLSYTWHSFTDDWARAYKIAPEFYSSVAAERRSKVAFDIEELSGTAKLTVVHDGFEPGSTYLERIARGWPVVLSNLKTLLETGDVLPDRRVS